MALVWISAHDATRSRDCAVHLCTWETDGRHPFCRHHVRFPPVWARPVAPADETIRDDEERQAA